MRPDANLFVVISRYFWLLSIVVTFLNGVVWWRRAQPRIAENPALEPGYRRIIKGWLIYGNLPWLVMAVGIMSGAVPDIWHYFNPRNGPFVIAFFITVIALYIASFYWVFFRGGAEDLATHPGLLNVPISGPSAVKGYFLVSLAGGIAGLVWIIFGNLQSR